MKNIILGVHNYHDVNNSNVPAALSWEGGALSWYFRIFPFVEQAAAYEGVVQQGADVWGPWQTPVLFGTNGADIVQPFIDARLAKVSLFICPSRGVPDKVDYASHPAVGALPNLIKLSHVAGCYAVCLGPSSFDQADWSGYGAPYTNPWYIPSGQPFRISDNGDGFRNFAAVTDGLSNTMFFGEVTPPIADAYVTSYGDIMQVGGCGFTTRWTPNNITDPEAVAEPWTAGTVGRGGKALCYQSWYYQWQSYGARSFHSGGINVAMGDGSVHFLSDTIAHANYSRLGNGGDGESVSVK